MYGAKSSGGEDDPPVSHQLPFGACRPSSDAAIIAVSRILAYPIVITWLERGEPQAAKEEAARVYEEPGHVRTDDWRIWGPAR